MPRPEPKLSPKELHWAAIQYQDRALYRTNYGLLFPLLTAFQWAQPHDDGSFSISFDRIEELRTTQRRVMDAVREYEQGASLAKVLGLAGKRGGSTAHGRAEKEIEDAFRATLVARFRRELGMGVNKAIDETAEYLELQSETVRRSVNNVIKAVQSGEITLDMPEEDGYEAGRRL